MNPRYLLALASFIAFLQIKSQNLEVRYFSGSIEDSIQVMESLETIRQIYSRQQYDSVIHACQNILEISNEIQFTRGKGEAYFLKGRAFNRLSYKYKALEMYKLAFEHFQLLNDHIRLASTLNNWGITLKSIGNFREAIQTGEKALEHAILEVGS
ncbi:MAG: hypothetical protein DHS20C17_32050 [Cyclobacteriaceae bacterium]|nr:MAG: hypothetical protein DHS20C17_32050 [Cyclobacteriaceae bacterium]